MLVVSEIQHTLNDAEAARLFLMPLCDTSVFGSRVLCKCMLSFTLQGLVSVSVTIWLPLVTREPRIIFHIISFVLQSMLVNMFDVLRAPPIK
jgi:hypothetical protein